jgi:ubiquinone/menaquinone biosynthesis C-methylase UbiE
LQAQVAKEANRNYETPESRAGMLKTLGSETRLAGLQPALLIERLQIRPGSTVVDLGTGPGTLIPQLGKAVGPKGRLIAQDIHEDFIDGAKRRASEAGLKNVEFILGTDRDPKLPAGVADLIVVVDAYHHFDYPNEMLAAIKAALKPGGRLAILEYHKKRGAMNGDPDFAITHVRATDEQVVKEVEAAGFRRLSQHEHAPGSQYLVVFQAR